MIELKNKNNKLPLNIQMFASGNIQESTASWNGTDLAHRARFNGSYTQNLDNGTTTITINCYADLYSGYVLGDVNGKYRFYLNSGAGAWFNQYFILTPVWNSTGYYSKLLKTDSRTINCNADGTFTQYNLQAYGALTVEDSTNGSTTGTSVNLFPTIPAKIGTVSNFNSNSTISIPINRFSNDYTKKLIISIGNTTIKQINNITSSDVTLNDGTGTLQVTLSSSEKNIIYNNSLTTNTPTIKFKLETYSNNELYYSSETTAICTLQDVNPVISNVTYSNSTSAIGGDNVIENTSNITITCNLQLKNNATLTSLKCNGQNMTLVSGSQYTVTLNNQNTGTFTIEAIDSRTNRTTSTITKTLINYIQLTQNATFKRASNTSGKVLLDYSGNYWTGNFGVENNTLSISWNYREKGAQNWITGTSIFNTTIDQQNNTYNQFGVSLNTLLEQNDNFFDYTKNYEFQLIVEDKVQQIKVQYSLNKGISNTAFYEDGYMYHNGDIDITGEYMVDGTKITENNGELYVYANKKLGTTKELATLDDLNGVTLFENLNGSNTNITLTDSTANYNMIEIFYKDTISNSGNSIRILKPNGKNFSLSNFVFGDGTTYTKLYIVIADGSINGTAINFLHNGYNNGAGNYADARTYILKVVGYK